IMVPPGRYTVKLSANGKDMTQPLEVRKDPNSGGSEEEIAEQTRMLLDVRADVERAADVVNRMESVRGQLQALTRTVKDTDIIKLEAEAERKCTELEMTLVELRATGRGQDGVRWGAKLYSKFNYLANGLASNDYRPTAQQIEVHKGLKEQLEQHETTLTDLASKDVNRLHHIFAT